jgi:hypothetical protein
MSLSRKGVVRPSFISSRLKFSCILFTPPGLPRHIISVKKDRSTLGILQEVINEKCSKKNLNPRFTNWTSKTMGCLWQKIPSDLDI